MRARSAVLLFSAVASNLSGSAVWAFSLKRAPFHAAREYPSALRASIAPDEFTATTGGEAFAEQPMGEQVSEGTVIASFKGGLAAVQLVDSVDESNNLPTVSATGDDLTGRLALFSDGSRGVVIAQRPPITFVFSDRQDKSNEGVVKIMDTMASVEIGNDTEIIDCFGIPAPKDVKNKRAIFSPIPKVADIALINSPMLTGTTMVDALAPIGKGQNMLVIGPKLDEMRDLACNFVAAQIRKKSSKCIYATTRDRQEVLSKLERLGIKNEVIVVAGRDGVQYSLDDVSQAAEAVVCAATACSVGEAFAKEGMDALVIVDTLDQHKTMWDATTRVLVDVYGADAVVAADRNGGASSEMRAFYSSLIQRAGQYNEKNGGGSLTLTMLTTIPSGSEVDDSQLTTFSEEDFEQSGEKIGARIKILAEKNIPLTEANLRKLEIPIPTAFEGKRRLALQHIDDLISMSDGQIWLDDDLSAAGQRPPLDPKRSITRVGIGADTQSRADAPALRRVVEGLRLDLAQAASMDGAEATNASAKQTRRKNAWLLAMHQEVQEGGRTLSESCVALLAARCGALDRTIEEGGIAGSKKGKEVISGLLDYAWSRCYTAMVEIDTNLDITPERKVELEELTQAYFLEKV